jgi:putative endopeptidase
MKSTLSSRGSNEVVSHTTIASEAENLIKNDVASQDDGMGAWPLREGLLKQIKEELPDDVSAACDFTVEPCVNFYEFACGTWIKETVIPANEAKVLKSWGATDKRVKEELRMIFEDQTPEPEAQRLNDWYSACMDMQQVERFGLEDLKRVLAQVDTIVDTDTLNAALVYLSVLNMQNLFTLEVKMPAGEHDHYSLAMQPSGLTLANAAMYIQQDKQKATGGDATLRYLNKHFATLNELTGRSTHAAVPAADHSREIEIALLYI